MKKAVLVLLFFVVQFSQAQIVNIPDANFKNKLIALGVDTNVDGSIQQSEALAVTTLNVSQSNISSMEGIQYFTNLTSLDCHWNQLTSLNVSSLTNLTNLQCSDNHITSLDVSSLVQLRILECNLNQISVLNVTPLVNLTRLLCQNNLLTNLNVSTLTNLTNLQFGNASLNLVDVGMLFNLNYIGFYGGLQNNLNISNLINLHNIWLEGPIISFDLSNINPNFYGFSPNGVQSIIIENVPVLTYLNLKAGILWKILFLVTPLS